MRWRFVVAMIGVVALVVFSFDYPLVRYLSNVERDRIVTSMERDSYVLAGRTSRTAVVGGAANRQAAQALLGEFAQDHNETAAIIDSAGFLVASTDPSAAPGTSYMNRPEVVAAVAGDFASGVRESVTLGGSIVYVSVPIVFGDQVLGAVRLTTPKTEIDEEVDEQIRRLVIAAIVSLIFAAAVAVGLSSLLIRPVNALRRNIDDMAEGKLDTKVSVGGPGELRHLSRAFARMSERVQNMLERQRSFAGDAAHQLRSPLTSIRLRLEQALSSVESGPTKVHLEAALADTDRMANLTESLLRLARTEGAELPHDDIDLASELERAVEQWVPLAEESGIDLRLGDVSVGSVRTSSLALNEILGNFIDNAISYSPPRSTITISARALPTATEIAVADQGVGMSDEDRARAFDRFWRGANDTRGAGLGLAIVAQLAENAGMRVELRAGEPGVDAVISIPHSS
jgi:signal transduction histidine kinase